MFVSFFSCPHPVLCPAAPNIFTSTKQYNCTASSSRGRRCGGLLEQLSLSQIFCKYLRSTRIRLLMLSLRLATDKTKYCLLSFYCIQSFVYHDVGWRGRGEALESCFIAHFTAIQHFQVLFEDIKRNHTLTFRDTLTSSLASLN